MYSSKPYDYQTPAPPSKQAPNEPAIGVPMSSYGQGPTEFSSIGPSSWSTGLCDCSDDPAICCITCWCPCITFGRIAEIVDKGSTSCITSGAAYSVLAYFTGFACIYSCCYRSKMRNQYMLPEDPCPDFLVHCCCESCAICQEYRELQHRGFDMSVGWEENMARQNRGVVMPPVAPGAMSR